MDYGYKPTTNGRSLIAKCGVLEKPLRLTRVAFGSGLIDEGINLADVHELINCVVDGEIGERTHENDRLFITVQYDNSMHPEIGTFYLNEFIVYAEDPETGEEVDLLYATLGDYKQAVPAYTPAMPPSVWKFPISVVVSDEINVAIDTAAGFVTYDDLHKSVEDACKKLIDSMATGGIKKTIAFTMEPEDWQEDPNKVNGYGFFYDLKDSDITASMVPDVTIAEESLYVAALAGMCVTSTSYGGYVRLKCVIRPDGPILASCNLLVQGALNSTSIIGLPPATSDTLGAVIVEEGSGLKVDKQGRLSIDAASNEEVSDVIDDAFGGDIPSVTPPEGGSPDTGDYEVADDAEVSGMLNDIFGKQP